MNIALTPWLQTNSAFYGSHFSQKHTSISSELQVGEVRDQTDGWNLSVVFQAPGLTSYSNLTSVFWMLFFKEPHSRHPSSFRISLPLLNTVIKQVVVANILA